VPDSPACRSSTARNSECGWFAGDGCAENPQPSLRVVFPGHPDNDSAIDVISRSMLQQSDQAPANRNTCIYSAWDSKERGPPGKQMNTRFNMKWMLAEIAIISRSSFTSLGHLAQLAGEN